jgi:hypothetical protein
MSRFRVAAVYLIAAIAFLGIGFWLGVREGSRFGQLVLAPPRGALAVHVLTDIKVGKLQGARIAFESEVDRGLFSVNDLLESPMRPFISTVWGADADTYKLDAFAVVLANYRKANASPFSGEFIGELPTSTPDERAFADDIARRNREYDRIINSMIERYATK